MSIENIGKFEKASSKATTDGIQHLVLTMQDGKLVIRGSSNFVLPLADDPGLCERLRDFMQDKTVEDGGVLIHATNKMPAYKLLPVSPFSPEWNGQDAAVIRKILTEMLNEAGFKATGRKRTLGTIIILYFIFHNITKKHISQQNCFRCGTCSYWMARCNFLGGV